jgi:hypothetical protein
MRGVGNSRQRKAITPDLAFLMGFPSGLLRGGSFGDGPRAG